MNSLHDLFLLMFTLSQMRDRGKVIELFQESITELFKPLQFVYSEGKEKNSVYSEEISTHNFSYGYISSAINPNIETQRLLQNAIQMLAVILDRLRFENELEKKAETLESIDKQRLHEINNYIDELETAKLASLNLIEDLKIEIAEKETAEQALKKSEEKFRLAFITSPDSININRIDDGLYVDVNEGFTSMTGYTENDIIGKTSIKASIWQNTEDRNRLVNGLQEKGSVKNLEAIFVKKDGSTLVGLMSASIIQLNNEAHLISITRDITEIKAAQVLLKESEERYRQLLVNLEAGIVVHSADTTIKYSNNRASELLGLSDDQMRGKQAIDPHWKFIHENKTAFVLEEYPVNRVIRTKKPLRNLILGVIRPETNDMAWLNVNGFPDLDSNGQIKEVIISFIEITEQKLAAEEIQKLNQELELRVAQRTLQLEEANKELESFVYSVSHDLRAPLRSIMGFSQIISRRHKDHLNDEGRQYFDYILEASQNMGNLIEDLLRFSRMTKGSVDKELVDLNDVMENVKQNLNQDILVSGAQLIIPENLPGIMAERSLLMQVFTNLIQNAMKYHRKNVVPEVVVSLSDQGNNWVIKIKDNGLGIAKEHHDKIFNIFQRLHPSDEYSGTGIGLAIVKKAIATLGGSITLDSEVNDGTTFFVTLPQ